MHKISTISGLQQSIRDKDIKLKKKWGQNFLIDDNILKKIAAHSRTNQKGYVVEIGPGAGALTQELAGFHTGVLAIDIDTSLKSLLEEVLSSCDNVHLVFQDILETDIEKELVQTFGLSAIPSYSVCANIPYNITTPIIFKLLEQNTNMQTAILMIQKEVARRILAQPGSKDYGLLTLTVAYHAEVEFLMNVSASCFFPRPQVDSSVIKITPRQDKKVHVRQKDQFIGLLKYAFQKRRKTMLNITSSFFTCEKKQAEDIFKQLEISSQRRPETLSLEDFARLADAFHLQNHRTEQKKM